MKLKLKPTNAPRKPGVPSQLEMYAALKARSEELMAYKGKKKPKGGGGKGK